jgi:macrolide-specific efflux system membrane fusion protein
MKTKLILSVSLGILAIAIVTGGVFHQKSQYKLIHPIKGNVVEAIYGLGKVKTESRYEVKVGVMTTVEKLYAREGDDVTKGGKLIKFKDSAIFRAPFAGRVTLVNQYEMETVLPQAEVLRMEDLQNRHIEVSLEQNGALRVREGQEAKVIFESLRNQKYMGKVKSLFPRDDDFIAHIDVENLPKNVLPGMTADVAIVVGNKKNVQLIPVSAINNGFVTFRRNGERKRKVEVKVGTVDGKFAEILESPLEFTDEIVIRKEK